MKTLKLSAILLFSLVWIFITNYRFYPINNLGSLLTYQPGLLSLEKPDSQSPKASFGKKLTIKIDTLGIPYIYAKKDTDLAFGLGYMHAKDRYFQMELMAKMVRGELSSILGARVTRSDKFWKPYEFDTKSKELLEEYKATVPELYTFLESYSHGVNSYIEKNSPNDPLYTIFNLKPGKWKPEYCLLVTWYMSRNLAYFDYHMERQELMDKLPEDLLEVLYPQKFDSLKTILPSTTITEQVTVQEIPERTAFFTKPISTSGINHDIGSNNWAINSAKSSAKVPLISNDPHLYLTLPGAFYETSLIGNQIKAYGYTIPGIPLIISGHNTSISWGITNGEWDLTDRYLLKTKHDSLYYYEGNWVPFLEKKYRIEVRGQQKETFSVKKTVHGFVKQEGDAYYAQKWYPSNKNYSVKALFNVMHAATYTQFKNALNIYDYPPQNFIYADVNDTIGIVCAGKLPRRPSGYNGGLLDGTKAPLKEEFIPKQWETANPKHNYLFSANQLPVQNEYYFGAHWHKDDYRVTRINELLKSKNNWGFKDLKVMQLDETDLSFFDLKEIFKDHNINNEFNYIKELFSSWNGDMAASSEEAFIYENLRLSVEEEAKNFAKKELKVTQAPSMKSFLNYLKSDLAGTEYSSKEILLNNVLKRTDSIIAIENKSGEKKYNHKSKIFIYNISFLPGFGYKIPDAGGNKNTINMNATVHPVFRSVFEMKKDRINGYTIMAGGQSGLMNAKNYSDQIRYWNKGKYKKTQFSENPENLKNIVNTISFQ